MVFSTHFFGNSKKDETEYFNFFRMNQETLCALSELVQDESGLDSRQFSNLFERFQADTYVKKSVGFSKMR